MEDKNFALFNYVNELNNEIELLQEQINEVTYLSSFELVIFMPGGGGEVLPYKDLMKTCGQPGYVFRDFCLKQGTEFIILS